MTTQQEKEFLNIDELAEWLGITKEWIYDAKAGQQIPYVQFGRQLRFHVPTIKEWISENSHGVIMSLPRQRQPIHAQVDDAGNER